MKKTLTIVTLLAMVISAFFISLVPPNEEIKQPVVVNQQSIDKIEIKSSKNPPNLSNSVQVKAKTPQYSNKAIPNIAIQNTDKTQLNTQTISDNPAAQFNNLPQEMQEEIKELSGRYNKNVQPIEVEPGVYMLPANKSIRVVPVAVMNKDGTVSTYEY